MIDAQVLIDMENDVAVRVIEDAGGFRSGEVIYRKRDFNDDELSCRFRDEDGTTTSFMFPEEVEFIVEEAPAAVATCGTIARPVLEERKIGKIAIELFDEGFPNAVMAIGEVMTWAAEHKGYKPHDWKNLPNADTAFSAAASRHRVKRLIQKVDGDYAIDQVDEESNLLHLAHEAFNVLAQLELTITRKIA